jgi:hypothetical protein
MNRSPAPIGLGSGSIRVYLSLFNCRFMIKHIAYDALIDIYGVEGVIYISYDT